MAQYAVRVSAVAEKIGGQVLNVIKIVVESFSVQKKLLIEINQTQILGAAVHAYINWAAKMAVRLGTGVPWVMCKEDDASDPVINACNGFYCDAFSPNKPYKPTLLTEAWSGCSRLGICSCSFHTKGWLIY
ncbi:hypothetical protein CRYUN_Cryun33cG0004200 [Craigia yunnanensis]